jgi:hypothetical protein
MGTIPGLGSGIPIRDMRDDVRSLSVEELEDRHGSAFLLLTAAELSMPTGPSSTQVSLIGLDDKRSESTAALSLVAFPVRHTGRSVGHLVTVGRAANNDVAVPDLRISRFHGFLKQGVDGVWQIQDAGSTNGTSVNGESVPRQGSGPAMDLKAGDNLRLGQVELTFLGVNELRAFVTRLER